MATQAQQPKKNGKKNKVNQEQTPPPVYRTQLSPEDEAAFRTWYSGYADVTGNNPDPDDPAHYYDYRGYWQENPNAEVSEGMHLPDTWKTPGHETFSDESKYYAGNENLAGYWDINNEYHAHPAADADERDLLEWENLREINRTAKRQAELRQQEIDQVKKSAALRSAATAAANKAVTDAENRQFETMGQAVKEAEVEHAEEKAEMDAEIKGAQQAARWTGLGELAASLVNVISAGAHGNNMQTPTFSQDWMAKADSAIKERRSRVRDMNEKIRQMRTNIENVRAGNIKSKAARDLDLILKRQQDADEIAKLMVENNLTKEQLVTALKQAGITSRIQALDRENLEAIRGSYKAAGRSGSGSGSKSGEEGVLNNYK